MWFIKQYREFLAALQFLSILSLPGTRQLFREDVIGSRVIVGGAYFPFVGLILALLLGLLALLTTPFLPPLVVAALLVIAQVVLTGGLHLDGLMDSCDGLFGGKSREQRLEIMRDSRVGSFGVLGGACILLLKFACFASLSGQQLFLAFLMTMPSTRWAMVLALYVFPSARTSGLGNFFRQGVTREHMLVAGMIALTLALLAGHVLGILLWGMITLFTLGLGAWITRLLKGLTGDSYGAIEEVTEAVALLVLVAFRVWF